MDLEAKKIVALKEELRRDLEALERVERLMASKNGVVPARDDRQAVLPINISVGDSLSIGDDDDDTGSVSTLRSTIDAAINADASVKWTNQKMLSHLRSTGYRLRAQKPIYSIGQAMKKLEESGRIRLVRKGAGNQPNIYKGKVVETSPKTEGPSADQGGEELTISRLQ